MDLCKIGHANLAEKKTKKKQKDLAKHTEQNGVEYSCEQPYFQKLNLGYGNLKESVTAGESLQANSSA